MLALLAKPCEDEGHYVRAMQEKHNMSTLRQLFQPVLFYLFG